MIANALFFTIVVLLAYGFWLLDQLKFMTRKSAVSSAPEAGRSACSSTTNSSGI
jgi:hypothetical protein